MATTSAIVDMETGDNVTWSDAFLFGDADDVSWSFSGQSFRMDLKYSVDDSSALLTLSTDNGRIVVADATQRVLYFNVPETVIQTLPIIPANYVYDLIMYDTSNPAIRVELMHGKVRIKHGVTGG